MAVFRNKSKPESAPAIHSLLGKDVMFKGEIHTNSHSFRVEGVVEGTIHSTGEVSIAPGGLVKGTILAKHGGALESGRAEEALRRALVLEPTWDDLRDLRRQVAERRRANAGEMRQPALPPPSSKARGPLTTTASAAANRAGVSRSGPAGSNQPLPNRRSPSMTTISQSRPSA